VTRLTSEATELLEAGYQRSPDQTEITASNATAMLSLAQAYVASSRHADAIDVLEDDRLGPLTLVRDEQAVAGGPVFIQEAYRTALQAYIGSLSSKGPKMMEKARETMVLLQQAVGSDPAGKQRMLGIYVNLAQDVETQMKSATPEARKQMSGVFEAFLQELSAGSSDVGVLNWVAETFASLGAGFDSDENGLNEDAKKYYERSIAAFANLLSVTDLQPQLVTQVQARMATLKSQLGDYDGALADLQTILAKNPNAVNVQAQAARLLQAWAKTDPNRYEQAISGIGQGTKSPVWGWAKLASTTLRYEQFRDSFYEARYQMAACQLGLAQTSRGNEKVQRIDDALGTLTKTKQLYPTLGGEHWSRRYDELINKLQAMRGTGAK
jgi:tetratricopeptide (TPR) repeat protein